MRGRSISTNGKSCLNVSVSHVICAQADGLLVCPKSDLPKLISDFLTQKMLGLIMYLNVEVAVAVNVLWMRD